MCIRDSLGKLQRGEQDSETDDQHGAEANRHRRAQQLEILREQRTRRLQVLPEHCNIVFGFQATAVQVLPEHGDVAFGCRAGSGKTALTLETLSRRWFVASPF